MEKEPTVSLREAGLLAFWEDMLRKEQQWWLDNVKLPAEKKKG